jgi:hypothetical protein
VGGRKSYPLEAVVGKTAENAQARKRLVAAVRSDEPRKIAQRTFELLSKSGKTLDNLAEAAEAFEFVRSNARGAALEPEARRRLASKYLAERKKQTGAPADPAFDSILVETLAKIIRRGKRK